MAGNDVEFDAIVDSIYGAALGDVPWGDAIANMSDAVNVFAGSLCIIDGQNATIAGNFHFGWSDEHFNEYATQYVAIDPRLPAYVQRKDIEIYTDEMLITPEVKKRDLVFDWARKAGQHHGFGARLFSSAQFESTLMMGRSEAQGIAQSADFEALRRFLPHLRRSILLKRRIGSQLSTAAVDLLAVGILILDPNGVVVFANRAMTAIAAENDGVSVTAAGLRLADPDDHARYQRTVGQVRRRLYLDAGSGRLVLPASRPSGRRPYGIIVSPFQATDFFSLSAGPSVMVCVSDPTATAHLDEDALTALFGFTGAEARLAVKMVECGSLPAAAAACGVTEGTARQYMKRMLSKTGTKGQVELVALMMGSVKV